MSRSKVNTGYATSIAFVAVWLGMVSAWPAPVAADWDPGDEYKMHYPQLPDLTGWDVSLHNEPPGGAAVLADDWACTEDGWIDDIHFWTSWRWDMPVPIVSVRVRIYSNYDVGHPDNPHPYSVPGELLSGPGDWVFDVGDFTERWYDSGEQGWFDPLTGQFDEFDHWDCYQINISNIRDIVPEDQWVWQNAGEIYWLSIRIIQSDEYHFMGWKTSSEAQFEDAAVFQDLGLADPPYWTPLEDPMYGFPLDLAFVITSEPADMGACCPDDGICELLTQAECDAIPGTYMGDGSDCNYFTSACCFHPGCENMDPICCEPLGGQPSPTGAGACEGDNSGNGVDDACEYLDRVVCEPQPPNHPSDYWYRVTPEGFGRCDFHVRVFDTNPANYTSWNIVPDPNVNTTEDTWRFLVHQVGSEWWASWWDDSGDCLNAFFNTTTFSFTNASPSTWGDWSTTIGNSSDPYFDVVDSSGNHTAEPNGYGYLVHVPRECPTEEGVVCEPQTGPDTTHPAKYWYEVTHGGFCDFHVRVYDPNPGNYANWLKPAGWSTLVHRVGDEWWASWWDPTTGCELAIQDCFTFGFDNDNPSVWGDWTITTSNSDDPYRGVADASSNHTGEQDGYGYRVHVPSGPHQACCEMNGNCVNTSAKDCVEHSGDPQGPGTDCDTMEEECPLAKWSQPPLFYEDSTYPDCFWGWDELSIYGNDGFNAPILMDDWWCTTEQPITDIHWWGSYAGYYSPIPPYMAPEVAPDRFHIGLWSDVGIWAPSQMIYDWIVPRSELDERWVGCDFHSGLPYDMPGPDLCFRYDFKIPPEEWFYQEDLCQKYWVSIAAIYDNACACDGDSDGDGDVDGTDTTNWINCWAMAPELPPVPGCEWADLDCDGRLLINIDYSVIITCQQTAGWADPDCCTGVDVLQYPWGWKTHFMAIGMSLVQMNIPASPLRFDLFGDGNHIDNWGLSFVITTSGGEPPPPEPNGADKNRYISMVIPQTAAVSAVAQDTAIRVKLTSLHPGCDVDAATPGVYCQSATDCPRPVGVGGFADCLPSIFPAHEGEYRYVNAIKMCRGGTEAGTAECYSQADCDARGLGGTCEQAHTCQGGAEPGDALCGSQADCDVRRSCQGGAESGRYPCTSDLICDARGLGGTCQEMGGTCLASMVCPDSEVYGTTFRCAKLTCDPEYRGWAMELGGEALHVTGPPVIPSSRYDAAQLPSSCQGNEASCADASAELPIFTALWGNVDDDPQLNVLDSAEVVDKVKELVGALTKPRAQLQPDDPNPYANVNVLDVANAVDALKDKAYPFGGPRPCN